MYVLRAYVWKLIAYGESLIRPKIHKDRLDFLRSLASGLRSFPRSAGSFPKQRLIIEPTRIV